MAKKEIIRDFVIAIGLETAQADVVVSKLEKKIMGISKAVVKQRNAETAAIRAQSVAVSRRDALEARRIRALAPIEALTRRVNRNLTDPRLKDSVNSLNQRMNDLAAASKRATTATEFAQLATHVSRVRDNIRGAEQQQRKLNRTLTRGQKIAKGFQQSMQNLLRSYASIFAIGAAATGIFRVNQEFQQLNASLLLTSGSIEQAGEDFQFIEETSNALGINVGVAAKGFQRINFAARSAGLSLEESKNIFLSATEASRAFGLNVDDTNGVLRAFDQILSKGKLSAEELRGQLGDRLTGAFFTAANAMGLTDEVFTKMLETGQIMSKEFITPFANELREVARQNGALEAAVKTSTAELQRFNNAVEKGIREASKAGLETGLVNFFQGLSALTKGLEPAFRVFGRTAGIILSGLGIALRFLALPLETIALLFERAFNALFDAIDPTKKLSEESSVLTRILRALSLVLLDVAIGWAMIFQAIRDFAKEASDDQITLIGQAFEALGVILGGFIAAKFFKRLTKSFRSLKTAANAATEAIKGTKVEAGKSTPGGSFDKPGKPGKPSKLGRLKNLKSVLPFLTNPITAIGVAAATLPSLLDQFAPNIDATKFQRMQGVNAIPQPLPKTVQSSTTTNSSNVITDRREVTVNINGVTDTTQVKQMVEDGIQDALVESYQADE